MSETRAIYAEASRIVSRALNLPPIEGGTFAFVKAPGDCDDFLIRCADRGVLLTPGQVCGDHFADWYRICFTVIPPSDLEKALAVVKDVAEPATSS